MKIKKTGKRINLLAKRIQSLFRKGNGVQSDQAMEKVKSLESDLNAAKGLQVEISELKGTLKSRKRALADGVVKLEKGSKKIKKVLKSAKKDINKAGKKIPQSKVKPAGSVTPKSPQNNTGKSTVKSKKPRA